ADAAVRLDSEARESQVPALVAGVTAVQIQDLPGGVITCVDDGGDDAVAPHDVGELAAPAREGARLGPRRVGRKLLQGSSLGLQTLGAPADQSGEEEN